MAGPLGATQWMYDVAGFYPTVLEDSLKFNDNESQYLSWTPDAAGNRKTWTWSAWVKRGNIGSNQYLFQARIDDSSTEGNKVTFYFLSDNTIRVLNQTTVWKQTSAVFRDTSAWYHIVLSVDTTNSTTNNRVRIYINGEEASYSTNAGPSLNADLAVNSTNPHYIGQEHGGYSYFDGYMSDINFIDGQALDPTNFGEFKDSIWIPSRYNGTYGTNGFHLEFKNDDTVEGFNTVTYRGTGANQSISGLGFEPDFVWLKSRTSGGQGHRLIDTVRGAPLSLKSHATDAEFNDTTGLTSFNADGFTLGTLGDVNTSGNSYVGWAWDAGGAPTADNSAGAGATPTAGSVKIDGSNKSGAFSGSPNIAVTRLSANTARGFSIVTYTGSSNTSFPHGLSSAPKLVIIKQRSGTAQWAVYHTGLSSTSHYLNLDDSGAEASYGSAFISPGSNTITIDANSTLLNANSSTYVAYCFAEVAGYSSFGSYSGNGSTQTITTGFAPAFVMIKSSAGAAVNWNIYDNTRKPANPNDLELYADLPNAEYDSGRNINFTSTGFELDTANYVNNSGVDYIYMAFADTREAAFWRDTSGNNNNWTPNNLDYRDSLIDVPTNNFAVLNANDSESGSLSEGNLKLSKAADASGRATFYFDISDTTGWYWEQRVSSLGTAFAGIANQNHVTIPTSANSISGNLYGILTDARKVIDSTRTSYGSSLSNGDIIGVHCHSGKVDLYLNGAAYPSASNTLVSGLSGYYAPIAGCYSGTPVNIMNFGQDSTFSGNTTAGSNQDNNGIGNFKYSVPSGYLALCTANLPTPSIVDGSEYFNTLLWTGNGSNPRTLSGLDFAADFIWHKSRSSASMDHNAIQDVVRGFNTNNNLYTSLTAAETTYQNRGVINSVSSTGFTFNENASDYSSADGLNQNNSTFVAWNWKAGGTAVSNTEGSITSQVSANTDAGFSVVSYTGNGTAGATVGHGLSSAPDMIIVKIRSGFSGGTNWRVYHSALGATQNLKLNTTAAAVGETNKWNDTAPTSSVFSLGNHVSVNENNATAIAYCFHSVDAYSKVGSFVGNGNADGPFVYTGFRPAWVMVKQSSAAGGWNILDNKRQTFNDATGLPRLFADSNAAEADVNTMQGQADFLSNGFKLRSNHSSGNASGATIIYLAFAENPFKHSNAR